VELAPSERGGQPSSVKATAPAVLTEGLLAGVKHDVVLTRA
jgi:hypothetical protein